jgi:hypothetical protein
VSNRRKKLTKEDKAKREARRARRKEDRAEIKKQMEAALKERRELEARAKRAGIELAKPSDIENIPKENLK